MKFQYFFFLIPGLLQASPLAVTSGGTGLATLTAANGIMYASSATAMAVLAIGTNGQALIVSGGLPAWSTAPAALPGYTATTGFAYAGSTSTIATSSSANRSMWISTNVPAHMTSSAVDNTVIGYNALNAVTSGTANTAIGSGALASTNSASGNTAIGYQALNASTAGPNTAVGEAALTLNSIGTNNTAVGYRVQFQILGSFNTSMGNNGYGNVQGSNNTGTGYMAGAANAVVGGNSNTCIGASTAAATNTLGNNNVLIGSLAGNANKASNTVAVGVQALAGANTGLNNTAVGNQALFVNTAGANNCGVGHQSLNTCGSGVQNTAVGSAALNKTTNSDSAAIGYNALTAVTSGFRMTALGSGAGSTATIGTNNIYLGYNALPISVSETNNTVIGNSSTATAYMFGIYGVTSASAQTVVINASAQLGAPPSSKRFKENIVKITQEDLDKLLDLHVVKFNYINDDTKEIFYGLIAEDVYEIMPEIVVKDKDQEIAGVQYDKLIGLLIGQVQKQQQSLDSLKINVESLQNMVQEALES